MSMQAELEKFVESLSEDKAKEILMDLVLPLSNLTRDEGKTFELIKKIYEEHFKSIISGNTLN